MIFEVIHGNVDHSSSGANSSSVSNVESFCFPEEPQLNLEEFHKYKFFTHEKVISWTYNYEFNQIYLLTNSKKIYTFVTTFDENWLYGNAFKTNDTKD